MADSEDKQEATSRGNEWEVVSLTSSAYAAAPGPEEVEMNDGKENTIKKNEADAMIMSGHFVFPPSQHENLPLEPEDFKVENMQETGEDFSRLGVEEGEKSDTKEEGNWKIEGLAASDEFPGYLIFDEHSNMISMHKAEFDERMPLQGPDPIDKEQSMYCSSKVCPFHSETNEDAVITGQMETSKGLSDSEVLRLSNNAEEIDDHGRSKLPSETWWKKGAASLYARVKEASAFRSIIVAAAVMGLVILGKHFQRKKLIEDLHLKWQLSIDTEKMKKSFGPISRFKAVVEGGSHRGSVIHGSSFTHC